MSTSHEAIQQALDALHTCAVTPSVPTQYWFDIIAVKKAIAALSHPVEPVASQQLFSDEQIIQKMKDSCHSNPASQDGFYLTTEEIIAFARAVIAALPKKYCDCVPTECRGEPICSCRWRLMGYVPQPIQQEQVASQATPARQEVATWCDEAADDIKGWAAHADEYFKDKWGLAGDIKKWRDRAALTRIDTPAVSQEQAGRDDVIEECAKVCDSLHSTISDPLIIGHEYAEVGHNVLNNVARAIRKLKDSQS